MAPKAGGRHVFDDDLPSVLSVHGARSYPRKEVR
jgi:hypothetical protein